MNKKKLVVKGIERTFMFNEGWKFYLGDEGDPSGKNYDDSCWRSLALPHDWSIELAFDKESLGGGGSGFLNGGIGWYRKRFVLPTSMKDKRILIDFGGVYMDSSVYVNGHFVGNYPNGYTPFSYDITKQLNIDGVTENVIAIKVVNQQPSSRWYSGSGIYRSVQLTITEPVHVARYGTYITTPNLEEEYAKGFATIQVETTINNTFDHEEAVIIRSSLYDADHKCIGEAAQSDRQKIHSGAGKKYSQRLTIPSPVLWDIDNPYRYYLMSEVIVNEEVVDCYKTPFGLRWYHFDLDKGFSLNGRAMKLQGVCMHHDQGALGAAAHYRAIERQMEIMQAMGVNSIRVTHNPATDELLEICNNLGLLVIDEAFDVWESPKRKNDYARFFNQRATHPEAKEEMTWAEYDIKQMVERGKNEPCIIMWSLGNEIVEASVETATKLNKWVKEIDPTRPTTQGHNTFIWGFDPDGRDAKVASVADVVGFNYGERIYDKARSHYPQWKFLGTENSSATRSRGEYAHPLEEKVADNHEDFQQSSYDNDRMDWGSTMQDAWKADRDRDYIAGEFIWTGFDYIGEPSPYFNLWPAKSSYFGAVDTAGFPKDAFYMYQSQWTSMDTNPMVHILPHWNWEDDDSILVNGKIPVHVYSNAASVELFLNGISLTEKHFVTKVIHGKVYQEAEDGKIYLEWLVPFEVGELKAVARDSSGKVVATKVMHTAGEATQMLLSADKDVLMADGKDLVYVTVDLHDVKGHFSPKANNLIHFEIEGEGQIIGVDNGNAIAVDEMYKDTKRSAYNGKALVIIQATQNEGELILKATSQEMEVQVLKLRTVKTLAQDQEVRELQVGQSNNLEVKQEIIGYEQWVVNTPKYVCPELPETIKASFKGGGSQQVHVKWEKIQEGQLGCYGTFDIVGKVDGHDLVPKIKVTVRGVVGIQNFSTATPLGVMPILPERAKVYLSDDTIDERAIVWDTCDLENLKTDQVFILKGFVDQKEEGSNLDLSTTIAVRVSNDMVCNDNLLGYKNGFFWPAPMASYTDQSDPECIKHIHDNKVDYTRAMLGNGWTNRTDCARGEDWLGIIIGREVEEKKYINNLEIDFISNGEDIDLPETYEIQYYIGETIDTPRYALGQVPQEHPLNDDNNWTNVSNLIKPNQLLKAATNYFTFDMVETYGLRVKMVAQANKHLGITELRGYEQLVKKHDTFDTLSIALDSRGEALVQAQVTNNASLTILDESETKGQITVIITAEDGIYSCTQHLEV